MFSSVFGIQVSISQFFDVYVQVLLQSVDVVIIDMNFVQSQVVVIEVQIGIIIIVLGDIFNVQVYIDDFNVVFDIQVSVLDILFGVLLVVDGKNVLVLCVLVVNFFGVVNVDFLFIVIELLQIGVGLVGIIVYMVQV